MLEILKKHKQGIMKMLMFFPISVVAVDTPIAFITINLATILFIHLSKINIGKEKKEKFKNISLILLMLLLYALTIIASVDKACTFVNLAIAYGLMMLGPSGEHFKNDLKKVLIIALSFFTIEFLNGSIPVMAEMYITYKSPYNFGMIFNLCIICFAYYTISTLVNGRKLGIYLTTILLAILSIINFFVVQWTQQSVIISDIIKLRTAMSVAGKQSFTTSMLITLVIGVILWSIVFMLIHKTKAKKNGYILGRLIKNAFLLMIMCFLVMFANQVLLNFNGGQVYGVLTNLTITTGNGLRDPENPINYNKYKKTSTTENNKPNVIIIMSEAYSDLSYSSDKLQLSDDYRSYFKELCKSNPSGIAYSSVYGNNTVTSEAECLTGTSSLFSTEGAKLWREYVTTNTYSIVKDFNSYGYDTYGIHPSYSFSYNRNTAWQNLGFKNIWFLENLQNNDTKKYRDLVTDEQDYEYIMKAYENSKKNSKPFFCFNVTMQNHAAYSENLSSYGLKKITSNVKDASTKTETENYASLQKASDAALKKLINYFEKQKEETIILFFGDHQPMFAKDVYTELNGKNADNLSLAESTRFYKVPYLLWSNKKINVKLPEITSINYLSSLIYEVGSIKKPWNIQYNLELMRKYPVVTANFVMDYKNNLLNSMEVVDAINKKSVTGDLQKLKIYQNMSYNLLLGKDVN